MDNSTLAHTTWNCKYHIVFAPKFRRKVAYGMFKQDIANILSTLCKRKGVEIIEAEIMPDHVHMLIAIPPKYAVSQVVGYMKGKSAIHIARVYGERSRNFVGQHFWARGYFVSTVGRDEEVIRRYIRDQEKEDERLDQLKLM